VLEPTTPSRSKINSTTGVFNPSFTYQDLILYTGITSGLWAYDTTNNTSYEIKAGANSLRHMRDFTVFNGAGLFIAQVEGAAQGTGWGIYSVDLAVRAGSPEVYSATLRKSTSFAVNSFSGNSGFAKYGNLVFYSDTHNADQGSVWVMDSDWDAEPLVDINALSNTQAGHMVAFNNKLGFKARTSNDQADQAQYFILDISSITTTTVDGTPSLINENSPLLTRLTAEGGANLDVIQAAGIGGRYILINTQRFDQVYSYDTQMVTTSLLVSSGFNRNSAIRPYVVGGVELALLSVGNQVRTYNPANGDFGVQVTDVRALLTNGSAYEFALADTNGDGNSSIAAFGVADWSIQRWFHAPVASFAVNAAYKTVTFDANNGTGSMPPQLAATATPLSANLFENTGFVFAGWNTQSDGLGTSYADLANFPFTSDTVLYAQWAEPSAAPAPYTGPVLESFSTRSVDACQGTVVTITGSHLDGITSVTLQGNRATIIENTADRLVIRTPAGLTAAANQSLVITSAAGTLTHQNAFDVVGSSDPASCALDTTKGYWTQAQADGRAIKIYAKNPVGSGKVQFIVDGREIAWVNAVDASDPKLRVITTDGPMAGVSYLVRTISLNPGKNRIEIRVNGERVWRVTYLPRG
jgi:hypothetical protein